MMRIGIGSTNKTKVAACEQAVAVLLEAFPENGIDKAVFEAIPSQTGISEMPLSQQEMMKGALQRALFVYKNLNDVRFAIGLEGGVFMQTIEGSVPAAYLQNWVYVFDGKRGFYGSSPALALPDSIRKALYEERRELAEVMDTLSGRNDVRSKNGAFGTLTHDLITRTDSFKWAVISAMTPFFNKKYY